MILAELRERTRVQHERIERTVDVVASVKSLQGYGELLARFYGFYSPLEPCLGRTVPDDLVGDGFEIHISERTKTPLLARDLAALGYQPQAIANLPLCRNLPRVSNIHQALGCMYVLEGATLGGQTIRRLVQQHHGLDSDTGCAFFSSYGNRVGGMWNDFCAALTSHAERNPVARNLIISAASETFTALGHWVGDRGDRGDRGNAE